MLQIQEIYQFINFRLAGRLLTVIFAAAIISGCSTHSPSKDNQIEISGHTDSDGSHDYNQTLSEKRAEAVADYLRTKYQEIGSYITTVGYSFDRPVRDSSGNIDKAASRRVEFTFAAE